MLRYLFASEKAGRHGDMCRKWCELNQLIPEIEYIDMVDRMNTSQYFGKVKGKTERVPLPVGAPLDLYISGFSCKDNSLTNRHRQPVVTTSRDGESSQTLDASIKTILAMFPKYLNTSTSWSAI